jgi:hypothetical protein
MIHSSLLFAGPQFVPVEDGEPFADLVGQVDGHDLGDRFTEDGDGCVSVVFFGDAAGLLGAGAEPGVDGLLISVLVEAAGLGGGGEVFDDFGSLSAPPATSWARLKVAALRVWLRVPSAAVATFSTSALSAARA